ncbi:hypothetical protein TKK_0008665 [Trichogramma kaykai]|uniref:Maleylacetoacetate isomerase n=1 Tax=Trichogramma kaykai TaxID=54128 RepID=A0ABD2X3T0_9HYME
MSLKPILYSYWRSSCSWRVRIALNLKGIAYETRTIDLLKNGGENNSEDYRKINPMQQVPALHIDNHTLIDSLNIIEYLDETRRDPPLLPADPAEKARVREMCQVIVAGIQPVQNVTVLNRLDKERRLEWAQHFISRGFTAFEKLLAMSNSNGNFCYGDDITLADCCLVPQVYNARRYKVDLTPFPKIVQIDRNLSNHPAFLATHPDKQPDCQPD